MNDTPLWNKRFHWATLLLDNLAMAQTSAPFLNLDLNDVDHTAYFLTLLFITVIGGLQLNFDLQRAFDITTTMITVHI